jgi:hypothetical protein
MFEHLERVALPHVNPLTARFYSGTTLEEARGIARIEDSRVITQKSLSPSRTSVNFANVCTTNAPWALERAMFEARVQDSTPIVLESSIPVEAVAYKTRAISPDGKRNGFVISPWEKIKVGRVWVPNEETDWQTLYANLDGMDWDEAGVELAQILKEAFRLASVKDTLLNASQRPQSSVTVFLAA